MAAQDDRSQTPAHLISMIGGDSEIGALLAAVAEAALFQIYPPGHTGISASLGPEAQCFRGSVALPGRKPPSVIWWLCRLSWPRPNLGRTMRAHERFCAMTSRSLCSTALPIDMACLCCQSGRPGLCASSKSASLKGTKQAFLGWIGKALKEGSIRFPEQNGAISWRLPASFLERSVLPAVDDVQA